jgi:thiosulfate dehydrogenase [quinone] large subunit
VSVLLAVLQALVGYQWLVSGVDKLLYGQFPDQLGQLVTSALANGRLPDVFARFLREVVVPDASLFGYLIEFGEALAGSGLLAGALLTLGRPLIRRHALAATGSGARVRRIALTTLSVLTVGAAVAALFMALNYWVLDGMPAPWFTPELAYGGAIHPALFLALASAAILIAHLEGLIVSRRARRSGMGTSK